MLMYVCVCTTKTEAEDISGRKNTPFDKLIHFGNDFEIFKAQFFEEHCICMYLRFVHVC